MKMPENLTEVKLRQTDIYTGKILKLHIDDVRLPNGREAVREVVDHVDGAAVLALDEENRALVVWQYRYVFAGSWRSCPPESWIPAKTPSPAHCGELKEETGAEPGTLLPLGRMIPAPGCYGETLHLFLARDLTFGPQHLDADEFLNVERVPFDELVHARQPRDRRWQNRGRRAAGQGAADRNGRTTWNRRLNSKKPS